MSTTPNPSNKSGFRRRSLIRGFYIESIPASGLHRVKIMKTSYDAVLGPGLSPDGFFKGQRLAILRPSEDSVTIVGRITKYGVHECSTDAPEEVRQKAKSNNDVNIVPTIASRLEVAFAI